jgi:hypothetical protein
VTAAYSTQMAANNGITHPGAQPVSNQAEASTNRSLYSQLNKSCNQIKRQNVTIKEQSG